MEKKYLRKFIEIYKKEYGVKLKDKQALALATEMIKLYTAIYGDPYRLVDKK